MFDVLKMMGKVKEMESKMKEIQSQLQDITIEDESGGGMVKATANGNRQLIRLDIDDSLINVADKEVLKDLIVAAVNKAIAKADTKAKEYIKKSTKGIMPNIPGIDLSGFV